MIHILEDDNDIREVIGYVLSDAGYKVQASSTYSEFSRKIKNTLPDLFLLDIMLPDGDGRDICRTLKASSEFNMVPVILISANADKRNIIFETSADAFISKPFDIEFLVTTVKEKLLKLSI